MKNVPISIEEYKIKYSQDSLNSLYINLALNVRLYKEANRLTWGSFSAKGLYLDEIKVDILNHAKAIFVLITYIKELEKNNTTVHIADFREFYIEFVLKSLILRKVSSLISCSIRQASCSAVCSSTPAFIKILLKKTWRS